MVIFTRIQVVAKDQRPELQKHVNVEEARLATIYQTSWSPNITDRPQMKEIVKMLSSFH